MKTNNIISINDIEDSDYIGIEEEYLKFVVLPNKTHGGFSAFKYNDLESLGNDQWF